jgi:hypothetical protein
MKGRIYYAFDKIKKPKFLLSLSLMMFKIKKIEEKTISAMHKLAALYRLIITYYQGDIK